MSTIKLTLELTPEQLTKLLADLQGGSSTPVFNVPLSRLQPGDLDGMPYTEPDGKRRLSDQERDTLVSLLEDLNRAKEQQTDILQELEAQRRLREHWEKVAEEAITKRDAVHEDNNRLHQELKALREQNGALLQRQAQRDYNHAAESKADRGTIARQRTRIDELLTEKKHTQQELYHLRRCVDGAAEHVLRALPPGGSAKMPLDTADTINQHMDWLLKEAGRG